MEELKQLSTSHHVHRSHLTKTLTSVTEVLERDSNEPLPELKVISLTTTLEGLQRRKDSKIAMLIEVENKLETDIYECEELQSNIVETIAQLQYIIHQSTPISKPSGTHPAPTSELPVSTQRSSSPPAADSESVEPRNTEHTQQQWPPTDPTYTATGVPQIPVSGYNVSHLPKLNKPVFAGDPITWQPFWDSYDAAIHSNTMLSNVQKLMYLRVQLQEEAAEVILGFPLTNDTDMPSVDLLRSWFAKPDELKKAHMQALINLPNLSNTLTSLQQFHDSVESHTRSLTTLGKNSDSYGDMLVPMISGKLPTEIN